MSKHSRLLHISGMQMADFAAWDTSDFDRTGIITIGKKAVLNDMPHIKKTQCFSFNDILTLEYKRIIVYYQGHNHEVSGCLFHTTAGIRTLVCHVETYQKIKDAWFAYHSL